jgi:hypothetical protein
MDYCISFSSVGRLQLELSAGVAQLAPKVQWYHVAKETITKYRLKLWDRSESMHFKAKLYWKNKFSVFWEQGAQESV